MSELDRFFNISIRAFWVNMQNLKFMSLSTWGLNTCIKCKKTYFSILKLLPVISALPETHLKTPSRSIFSQKLFTEQYQAAGSFKSREMAILLSRKFRFEHQSMQINSSVCYIFVKGRLGDQHLTIASIYAPNINQYQF